MNLVLTLVANIVPLYTIILLGYIGGRWLDINIQSMARTAIFIISPIVTFGAMTRLTLDASYALLPLLIFCISLGITGAVYALACRRRGDNTANLIALGCVAGNTGYFGLPLALALYGPDYAGIYLLMNVATSVTELTVGYYLAARGVHTIEESLKKVARLPALHALWAGLLVNMAHIEMPEIFYKYWNYACGAWVYIGMMIIGIALSKLPRLEFDLRLAAWMFTAKFVLWPGLACLFIFADLHAFHLFPPVIHGLLLLFTTVPLMANLVAYAAQLNLHPEKAASTVLLSTLFAIVYMPCALMLARVAGLLP